MFTRALRWLLLLLFVASLGGCIVEHRWTFGWALFRWTVEERADASRCAAHGAATMDLEVYDDRGARVARTLPPCGDFSDTIELDAGHYSATMTLLDARGAPVSTSVTTGRFFVYDHQMIALDADFPANSFY